MVIIFIDASRVKCLWICIRELRIPNPKSKSKSLGSMVNAVGFYAKIAGMRPVLLAALISPLLVLMPARSLVQLGGGHMLFGDFKVDDSKVGGAKPETFHIILYTRGGRVVARDVGSNNGRYRVFEIP